MKRLCRLSLLVAIGSLGASAAPAQAGTELRIASMKSEKRCGGAADLADSPSSPKAGVCDVALTGSPESGKVGANVSLISPMDGLAPWSADAGGYSHVVATHHLDKPVPKLDFTARVHVTEARTSADRTLTGDWATTTVAHYLVPRSISGNRAFVEVSAGAQGPGKCLPNCVTGKTQNVLAQLAPETSTASGEDYVLTFTLTNKNCAGLTPNPDCGQIPAGDVQVTAGVVVRASQPRTWGTATAAAEGVVTDISVE